jgi:hypothetical protein
MDFLKKYGSAIGLLLTIVGFAVNFYIKSEITFQKVDELEERIKKIERKIKK